MNKSRLILIGIVAFLLMSFKKKPVGSVDVGAGSFGDFDSDGDFSTQFGGQQPSNRGRSNTGGGSRPDYSTPGITGNFLKAGSRLIKEDDSGNIVSEPQTNYSASTISPKNIDTKLVKDELLNDFLLSDNYEGIETFDYPVPDNEVPVASSPQISSSNVTTSPLVPVRTETNFTRNEYIDSNVVKRELTSVDDGRTVSITEAALNDECCGGENFI